MYRSALVALNPSRPNDILISYAVGLALRHGLSLHGIAVIDPDRVTPFEAVPIGGGVFKAERDELQLARAQEQVAQVTAEFARQCQAAGVQGSVASVHSDLADEIALTVQRHDLLLVGHVTSTGAASAGEPTALHDILRHSARPAMVIPGAPPEGNSIVIAYDGSPQAVRSLASFVASGFAQTCTLHVVSFDDDEERARHVAELARGYLESHGCRAESHGSPAQGDVAEAILQAVKRHAAGLLVMGAYGRSVIREFTFGSVTRKLLRSAEVPLFLDH